MFAPWPYLAISHIAPLVASRRAYKKLSSLTSRSLTSRGLTGCGLTSRGLTGFASATRGLI